MLVRDTWSSKINHFDIQELSVDACLRSPTYTNAFNSSGPPVPRSGCPSILQQVISKFATGTEDPTGRNPTATTKLSDLMMSLPHNMGVSVSKNEQPSYSEVDHLVPVLVPVLESDSGLGSNF